MKAILSALFLFIGFSLGAQQQCATQFYIDSIQNAGSKFSKPMEAAEAFMRHSAQQKTPSSLRLSADYIIRIPVVVHVLYYSPSHNISDAQIKSQIAALNRDFRRLNADTINTPERFKPFAADVKIEFALATADPNGRPTNGIVRKKTGVKYWNMDDKIKFSSSGGDDAWDSRYYLNIWVGDMRTYLGFSSAVGGPPEKDGIVINTSAFGTGLGRTATHEAGHWLGLKHIWGDTYCGDDGVDDTPVQGGFTAGCPNTFRSSCKNGSLGDMYMNYMDLTNDECMNLFTGGQRDRMRSLFEQGGPRHSILSSKGLHEPWVEESVLPEEEPQTLDPIKFYPNPFSNELVLNFQNDQSWMGKEIQLLNMNGVVVQKIQVTAITQRLQLHHLKAGIYLIQAKNKDKHIIRKLVKL